MSIKIGTSYQIDLKGTGPKLQRIVNSLRALTAGGEKLATYDGRSKLWTVNIPDGHFQAKNAVDYAESAGATVAEVAADPAAELRAERERLLARIAQIDAQLGQ